MDSNAYKTRIAAYNVGDYTGEGFEDGSDEGIAAIRTAIEAVGAEVWATQADIPFYGTKNGRMPRKVLFDTFKNYECRGTWHYNHKALITSCDVTDVEKIFYTETERRYSNGKYYHHPWFLAADIELGGKKVRFINIHVDWADNYTRAEQFRQIIEYAKGFERAVIIGDFNPDDCIDGKAVSARSTHEEDLTAFINAGFKPANAGEFGVFNTLPCSERAPVPCDNILVSDGITIDAVNTYTAEWMNDHAIIYADITIK